MRDGSMLTDVTNDKFVLETQFFLQIFVSCQMLKALHPLRLEVTNQAFVYILELLFLRGYHIQGLLIQTHNRIVLPFRFQSILIGSNWISEFSYIGGWVDCVKCQNPMAGLENLRNSERLSQHEHQPNQQQNSMQSAKLVVLPILHVELKYQLLWFGTL